jgi:hypothetical protein
MSENETQKRLTIKRRTWGRNLQTRKPMSEEMQGLEAGTIGRASG